MPHQCAHWFAMTCKYLQGVSVCKDAFLAANRQCPGITRAGGKFLHVIARSEATWQSVTLRKGIAKSSTQGEFVRRHELARSSTNLLGFPAGTRIATPVCALVRNDMQILARCQRLQGRFSGSKPAVPRYYAGRRQISTCHCEERSDVAIRSPAVGRSKIAVLRANS